MANPTIALIVDCSGSMTWYNYLDYAKTDAATFANIMQIGDGCCVVSFSDSAYLNQALITLTSQNITSVCTNIQSIHSVDMTNISAGIQLANQQIGSSASPHGMVLLSDGMWNEGVDPMTVLPNNIPIYTIALGDHGELDIMQRIATATSGTYNYAPGYRELARIYNNIAAQTQVAEVVRNSLDSVQPLYYKEYTTNITAGISMGTFTLNWDNINVAYTPNTPTGNQINIVLYDPNNNKFTGSPVYVASGSVVFEVANPIPGNWTVGCWYAGTAGTPALDCTWGTFEPPGTAALSLTSASQLLSAGEEPQIEVHFHDYENPIKNPIIRATVSAPQHSYESIAQNYAKELQEIIPDENLMKDGVPEDKARISALNQKMNGTLLTRHDRPLFNVTTGTDGKHAIKLTDTAISGTYNVHVEATGYSTRHKSMVQRTGIISIHVK